MLDADRSRRRAVWPARLQAAIRPGDSAGAARSRPWRIVRRRRHRGALAMAASLHSAPILARFLRHRPTLSRTLLLEDGDAGLDKMQSVFAGRADVGRRRAARLCDPRRCSRLRIGAALVWLWRSAARRHVKAAALMHCHAAGLALRLDYDLMILAPAIAFLRGRLRARLRDVGRTACWRRCGSCRCSRAGSRGVTDYRSG